MSLRRWLRGEPRECPDSVPLEEPLLSLEDDAVETRYALIELGRELFSSTLMSRAPLAVHRFERMTHPQVSDYVVEMSRRRLREKDPDGYRSFGRVLTVGDQHGDGWRLQYGPVAEDVVTWSDCSMVALPLGDPHWWRNPPGLEEAMERDRSVLRDR